MAVFTEVTSEDAATLLGLYGLPAPDAVTGIAEGTENTNYKILAGGKRYILTLYEARVAVADLPYFLALMEHIASQGLPSARPIRTPQGDRLTAIGGRPAALIEFLPGRPNMAPGLEDARKAGAFLARFHQAGSTFSPTRMNSMGPPSWRALAEKGGAGLDRFGDGVAVEIGDTLAALQRLWPTTCPRGTIHGDLFPDNLLLDHGDVSGVIDFYFACTDFLAYDLAIAMNAYTPETGDIDLSQAEAMLAGYETVRPLQRDEREALDTLLCGSALRFFLTRAVDNLFVPENSLYTAKDPLPWLRLMRHHRLALVER